MKKSKKASSKYTSGIKSPRVAKYLAHGIVVIFGFFIFLSFFHIHKDGGDEDCTLCCFIDNLKNSTFDFLYFFLFFFVILFVELHSLFSSSILFFYPSSRSPPQ